eukprot:c56549_g1_i1 orf=3-257(-)
MDLLHAKCHKYRRNKSSLKTEDFNTGNSKERHKGILMKSEHDVHRSDVIQAMHGLLHINWHIYSLKTLDVNQLRKNRTIHEPATI